MYMQIHNIAPDLIYIEQKNILYPISHCVMLLKGDDQKGPTQNLMY